MRAFAQDSNKGTPAQKIPVQLNIAPIPPACNDDDRNDHHQEKQDGFAHNLQP
jgi:hypothetical protein